MDSIRAYEIVYGKYDVKKIRVGLRERVGDEWKTINYIPLPHAYLRNCQYLRY